MIRQVEKLGKGSTYRVGNMCWQIQSFHFVKNHGMSKLPGTSQGFHLLNSRTP